MLEFSTEEKQGHLILRLVDKSVEVEGKPYSDWTVVYFSVATKTTMEVHYGRATERLKKRHERFLKTMGMPTIAPGRVMVGFVGELPTSIEQLEDD